MYTWQQRWTRGAARAAKLGAGWAAGCLCLTMAASHQPLSDSWGGLISDAYAETPSSAATEAAPASAVVDHFHTSLLSAMKTGGACAPRRKALGTAIDRDFDLPFLAQRVLRKRWADMSAQQRSDFTALFRELVVATYAGNFSSFNGEKFSTPTAQDLPDGTQMVKTQLQPASGGPVAFDYVLRKNGDHWQIVNILADGVSNLALWSSQYDRIYADNGFDGLMKQLGQQVEKVKKDCGG